MPKIIFKGITKPDADFLQEVEVLPEQAVRLKLPEHMMEKSMLFAIPFMLICFLCLYIKVITFKEFPFIKLYMPLGIITGILLCFVHELLHALPQPKHAFVYIGFIPKGFMFYMKCKTPISKGRFIFMSLLPVILGIIPLIVFMATPIEYKVLNSFMWPMAMIGLCSPAPDYLNVYHVLKEVPDGARIQDGEDGLYWYKLAV